MCGLGDMRVEFWVPYSHAFDLYMIPREFGFFPCVFPVFFLFFLSKIVESNVVVVFSVFLQVCCCVGLRDMCAAFGALSICIWFAYGT